MPARPQELAKNPTDYFREERLVGGLFQRDGFNGFIGKETGRLFRFFKFVR